MSGAVRHPPLYHWGWLVVAALCVLPLAALAVEGWTSFSVCGLGLIVCFGFADMIFSMLLWHDEGRAVLAPSVSAVAIGCIIFLFPLLQ